MRINFIAALGTALILAATTPTHAQQKADAAAELKQLITKVQGKLEKGEKSEKDLADNLKEFDALLASHKDEKTDDVAQILLMKGMLYLEVLDNTEKGLASIEQLKKDYPDTRQGKDADRIIAAVKQQEEGKKIQRALAEGAKFPDFEEKDLADKSLSIANFKGKVVLIDFWATWCGPCVHELPNVIKTYEAYHAKGLEVIGISLDQDREKLTAFTKEKNMPWQQYFDGKGWGNKLAVKYGIQSIPATFLLDGEGKIIGKNLRGESLEKAVAKALTRT